MLAGCHRRTSPRTRAAAAGRLRIGALDETGQAKKGTVHLAYIRERVGHILIAHRLWIPAAQLADTALRLTMGFPVRLRVASTKGRIAIRLVSEAVRDGVVFDFLTSDEVYGACTLLRAFLERIGQAYVLRVVRSFILDFGPRGTYTCEKAVKEFASARSQWRAYPAAKGAKGARANAWTWFGTVSSGHTLLVRKHRATGKLAYHYCWTPTRTASHAAHAHPRRRTPLARRRVLRSGQRRLRTRPIPGQEVHHDPPSHHLGLRGPRRLRHCRGPRRGPDRLPGAARPDPRPGTTIRSGPDPVERLRNPPPLDPQLPARPRRIPPGSLVMVDTPPPSSSPVVPPTPKPHPSGTSFTRSQNEIRLQYRVVERGIAHLRSWKILKAGYRRTLHRADGPYRP